MSGRIWAGELFRPAGLLADRHGGHSSGFERRLCRAMDTIAAFEELLSRN